MAGKYEDIIKNLLELPPENPVYQLRVQAMKKLIIDDPEISKSPINLANEYIDLRIAIEQKKKELSDMELSLEAFSQMLVESNQSADPNWGAYGVEKTTLRLITGDTVRVQREPYVTIFDKDKNRKWAVRTGLERSLALPWQTLNSHTKALLLKGEPEPDGTNVFVKTKVVYTAK